MKQLKIKAKQLPIEEVKLNALKYDQLQKQSITITKTKINYKNAKKSGYGPKPSTSMCNVAFK